jgi:hypothetical protein
LMLWFVAMDCVVSSAVIHSMETDAGLHVNYATFVLKCCRLVSLSLISYSTSADMGIRIWVRC